MKKVILAWLLSGSLMGFSQCPVGSVSLTNQTQVNNFATLYPTCTTISGGLSIGIDFVTPSGITDLTPLSNLTTITSGLTIVNVDNLTSVNGLHNIASIGDDFVVMLNQNLPDLGAMNNLTSIGGVFTVAYNDNLTNLDGLQNLTYVAEDIQISENPDMTSLEGLNGLTTAGEGIQISQMDNLSDISALSNLTTVNGSLVFSDSPDLMSLTGLEGITSASSLALINLGLLDLTGLENLTTLTGGGYFTTGTLEIGYNSSLTSLNGLESLSTIYDELNILSNSNLSNIVALHHSISIGDLTITGNTSLSQCAVESICDYLDVNSATISSNASGCNSETEVENSCAVPLTKLNTTWCGGSLTTFGQNFYANTVTGATQYEFEFKELPSGPTTTNIRPATANTLLLANLIAVGKTYEVRVRAMVGGVWGMYGDVCELDAPATIPLTKLNTTWCGADMNNFSDSFYANQVVGATQYEFEFTDLSTSTVTTNIRPTYYTTLQNAGLMTIGSSYNVRVRAYLDGAWGSYGDVCQLDAPATIPLTKLNTGYCNSQVTTFNANFYAISVAGATQYEFEFTDIATSTVTSHVRPTYYTNLQTAGLITLGDSYNVRVRAYLGGAWGSYGDVCQLDGPVTVPLTTLNTTYCGASLTSFTHSFYAVTVTGATQYEFEFTDISTSVVTTNVRPTYYTTLTLAGLTTIGKTYNVRVRAYLDGTWGSYGSTCVLTGPTSMILYNDGSETATDSEITDQTLSLEEESTVTVNMYPNPANEMVTLSTTWVGYSYQIYSVDGRLVANEDQVSGTTTIDVSHLNNGIYTVVILSGDQQNKETKQLVISK